MATDIQIQTNVDLNSSARDVKLTRASNGTLFVVYKKVTSNSLFIAYSTDSGLTWDEVDSGSLVSSTDIGLALAIDSQDIVHVAYTRSSTSTPKYRQFTIAGGWTAEETISATTTSKDGNLDIAIDSVDDVHVVFNDNVNISYNKRTIGTWGTESSLFSSESVGNNGANKYPKIAIDSNNYIYIVFLDLLAEIKYLKYTSFWTAAVSLSSTQSDLTALPSIAIDSADNVHIMYARANTLNDLLYYIKYTESTDTWAAATQVPTTSIEANYPTIAVTSSDVLNVVYHYANDIYLIQNTAGIWGSDSKIIDAITPQAYTQSYIRSTVWPVIEASHTNTATAGYHFTLIDNGSGVNILRYYASTSFSAPTVDENYHRIETAYLPEIGPFSGSLVPTLFTGSDYTKVDDDDNIYVDQTATDDYAIFYFSNRGTYDTDDIEVEWKGKSDIATSTSTVYLDFFNYNTRAWQNIDSDTATAAGTEFILGTFVTYQPTVFYGSNLWVTARVYQKAQ